MRKMHNIGNLNTEIEKKINRSFKVKKYSNGRGNRLDKINSRYKMAEERIRELEDRSVDDGYVR